MPGLATTIANKILDHLVGKAAWTPAPLGTIYVGLSSTTPTAAGTNVTEPSGGAYARVAIAPAEWDAAANGANQNNVDKPFPTATADWVSGANLTHFVFYDAAAAGNFLGFCPMTTPRAVLDDDTIKILSGELDLAFVLA